MIVGSKDSSLREAFVVLQKDVERSVNKNKYLLKQDVLSQVTGENRQILLKMIDLENKVSARQEEFEREFHQDQLAIK